MKIKEANNRAQRRWLRKGQGWRTLNVASAPVFVPNDGVARTALARDPRRNAVAYAKRHESRLRSMPGRACS
jgi:hypothetical protein